MHQNGPIFYLEGSGLKVVGMTVMGCIRVPKTIKQFGYYMGSLELWGQFENYGGSLRFFLAQNGQLSTN